MFLLGEFCEDEVKPVVNYLKKAGIKVEQKTYLDSIPDATYYLDGRLSELRDELKDIEKYEHYLAALKSALARGATPDNLEDLFFDGLYPGWLEKKQKAAEILTHPSPLSGEEDVAERNNLADIMGSFNEKDAAEMNIAYEFALRTLSRNLIDPDEAVGDRLDDPILRIEVNPDEYKDSKYLRHTLSVELIKRFELYIDEFFAIRYRDLDEEFQESYTAEFLKIRSLGILIKDLIEEPSSGKIDMDDFAERCDLRLENMGNFLSIDGEDVAEEIAKVLEKNGVIKIKGDTIKWKA